MKGVKHFDLKFNIIMHLVLFMFLAAYSAEAAEVKPATVGAKAFAENQIVGKLIQYALEDAGFTVKFIPDLENAVLQKAIESGEIDLCPEYTNTGITSILKLKPIADKDEAYKTVKEEYEKRFGITWLEPSSINNTYCLVITKEASDAYGIKTISDLQANALNIRAAKQNSWRERPDHLPGLELVYGPFVFKDETIYDNGLKYQILLNGKGDLTLGYTTDPQLEDGRLLALEDDKNFWAPYYLVPIIRQDTLAKYPEIEGIINYVTSKLSRTDIIRLSANVALRHEEYSDVAKAYYEDSIVKK
jgi:osmoprotectant transport system substrate-binding protein